MKSLKLYLTLLVTIFLLNYSSAQTIKVLTYNIYHGEENYNPGSSNIDKIAQVINKYKPDFVAMQEVDSMTNRTATFNQGIKKDLVQVLAKKTKMYGYFAKAIDYNDGGYGEGILSKYPSKPEIHHLSIPKGGEGRALIIIKHQFKNGKKIAFAGTHLCHQFQENRIVQAQEVRDILLGLNMPVVVGGDFNIRPNSDPYNQIVEGLDDAALKFGEPQLTFPFTNPKVRLDYFFINKGNIWQIKNIKVIDNEDASDHKPVLMTIKLKKRLYKNSIY